MWMNSGYVVSHSLRDGDSKGVFLLLTGKDLHRPWAKNEGVAELSIEQGIKELEQR